MRDRVAPLMEALYDEEHAIALWLVEHRGQNDVNTANNPGATALHYASTFGALEVVKALVAAGANPAACGRLGRTPLMCASRDGHNDIVAYLLQQPGVKASIDHIDSRETALSLASRYGEQPIVQLLDAGADPTIPFGFQSPVNEAIIQKHPAVEALLRHAIAEPNRARALHKVRSLFVAGAASLACMQGRVEQGEALPQHQFLRRERSGGKEQLRATAAFAAGLSGGEKDSGLCEDLYTKLQGYMLPAWADKGPEVDDALMRRRIGGRDRTKSRVGCILT